MIESVTGSLGGGKSYFVARRAMEYIASGGAVYTNCDFPRGRWFDEKRELWMNGFEWYLREVHGWKYQEGQLVQFVDDGDGIKNFHRQCPEGSPSKHVLAILDEAPDWFDAYERAQDMMEVLTFLRHSRKVNVDILFLSQDLDMLQRRLRVLCEFHWVCRDMRNFVIPKLHMRWPLNQFLFCQWDKYRRYITRRIFHSIDKRVFHAYRTDQLFVPLKMKGKVQVSFLADGKEEKKMKAYQEWALAVALLLAMFCAWRLWKTPTLDPAFLANQVSAAVKVALSNNPPARISGLKEKPQEPILYESFSQVQNGSEWTAWWRGLRLKVGDITPEGQVAGMGPDRIFIRGRTGPVVVIRTDPPPLPANQTAPTPPAILSDEPRKPFNPFAAIFGKKADY